LRGDLGERFVFNGPLRLKRDAFRPFERSALARGEDAGLTPDGEQIEFLGRRACLARVVQVILHAKGAAVDLRNADLHHLNQIGLKARLPDCVRYPRHARRHFRNDLLKRLPVDARSRFFLRVHGRPVQSDVSGGCAEASGTYSCDMAGGTFSGAF
jgi:hypothetical protein